jgi:hypothetical protein
MPERFDGEICGNDPSTAYTESATYGIKAAALRCASAWLAVWLHSWWLVVPVILWQSYSLLVDGLKTFLNLRVELPSLYRESDRAQDRWLVVGTGVVRVMTVVISGGILAWLVVGSWY